MDIEKIVFSGDSAGGHLTYSVTLLAMLRNFRLPDGIFSIYPCFTLDITSFFPSTMLATDDELISSGFMKLCSACLSRNGCNTTASPLLSPLLAPDAMIKLMPKSHYCVNEIDALRDHGYDMLHRMLKQGRKAHLHHLNDFLHGWLNFDTNGYPVPEFLKGRQMCYDILRDLLSNDEDNQPVE